VIDRKGAAENDGAEAVRLTGVTKAFGGVSAVSDLDLSIPRGSLYGLLGPNGSGKTTTLRMILGILRPDHGGVRLLGADPRQVRRDRIGYLPEERGLYRKMKVLEHLVFLARIRGVPREEARSRASTWLERLDLGDRADRAVHDLSKGMQQKVQFIGTVLHEPDLLILDEPFSGLDPMNQDLLEEIVRGLHAQGVTIVLSTHLMDQAERLCERVCFISRARLVLDGDLEELKRREGGGVAAIEFEGPDDWLAGPGLEGFERTPRGARVRLADHIDPHSVLETAMTAGARIRGFRMVEPRLHEIFVRHVGTTPQAEGDSPADAPTRPFQESVR
jgi:ABC-2 type transport system ATP-binding protein